MRRYDFLEQDCAASILPRRQTQYSECHTQSAADKLSPVRKQSPVFKAPYLEPEPEPVLPDDPEPMLPEEPDVPEEPPEVPPAELELPGEPLAPEL